MTLLFDHPRCKVFCGDALEYLPSCGDIACTVTSPPYNGPMNGIYDGGPILVDGKPVQSVQNWADKVEMLGYEDHVEEDEYRIGLARVAAAVWEASLDGASMFYNHKVRYRNGVWSHPLDIVRSFDRWDLAQEIIWARDGGVFGPPNGFLSMDERIYWLVKQGAPRKFTGRGRKFGTVWRMPYEAHPGHPCPFPTELPSRAIRATTRDGEWVCDPYAGSGRTAIAALQCNRRAIAIERDEQFASLIVDSVRIVLRR